MSRHQARGVTLIELLIVLAILGFFVSIAIPNMTGLRRRSAVRAAAADLRSIFHLARQRAITRGKNCALKFTQMEGEWFFAIYDDGDGDGVRNNDITKGIDEMFEPPRRVFPVASDLVSIGMPGFDFKDPAGTKVKASSSPVKFGNSALCSFSPMGESTPGSVYLTDDHGELYVVRVYGTTAKMRVLRYRGDGLWEYR